MSYGERFGRRCESIGVVGIQSEYVYTVSLVRVYIDIFLSLLRSDIVGIPKFGNRERL